MTFAIHVFDALWSEIMIVQSRFWGWGRDYSIASSNIWLFHLSIIHVSCYNMWKYGLPGQKNNFSLLTFNFMHDCALYYLSACIDELFLLAGFSVWRFTGAGKSCTQVWR